MSRIQDERRELPIYEFKEKIIELVKQNLFCIITGETGSGKSTQIAQYVIDGLEVSDFKQLPTDEIHKMLGQEIKGLQEVKPSSKEKAGKVRVVVTQPRRVAAIQMAKRVAQERGVAEVGREVGYTIRFDDQSDSEST